MIMIMTMITILMATIIIEFFLAAVFFGGFMLKLTRLICMLTLVGMLAACSAGFHGSIHESASHQLNLVNLVQNLL